MLLYSVASGVSCTGVLLFVVVVIIMLVQNAFAGYPFKIFKSQYGYEWKMIFLAVFAVASAAWGLTTVITLGYQPIDLFVAFFASILAFAFARIISQVLAVTDQPKHPEPHETTR
jgi:hypothetical protein